jgi:hypothetical protein
MKHTTASTAAPAAEGEETKNKTERRKEKRAASRVAEAAIGAAVPAIIASVAGVLPGASAHALVTDLTAAPQCDGVIANQCFSQACATITLNDGTEIKRIEKSLSFNPIHELFAIPAVGTLNKVEKPCHDPGYPGYSYVSFEMPLFKKCCLTACPCHLVPCDTSASFYLFSLTYDFQRA